MDSGAVLGEGGITTLTSRCVQPEGVRTAWPTSVEIHKSSWKRRSGSTRWAQRKKANAPLVLDFGGEWATKDFLALIELSFASCGMPLERLALDNGGNKGLREYINATSNQSQANASHAFSPPS